MTRKREVLASENIADLPPPTHRHPMSGEPVWDQHAVRSLLSQQLDDLLTEDDVARRYGVVVGTVQKWRRLRTGPAYLKVGGGPKSPVRYRASDLAAFDEKSLISPTPKEQ